MCVCKSINYNLFIINGNLIINSYNLPVSFIYSSMRARQEVLLEWTLMFFQSGKRASQAKELWFPYWMMVSRTLMLSFRIHFSNAWHMHTHTEHLLCFDEHGLCLQLSEMHGSSPCLFLCLFLLFFCQVWITPTQT